MSGWDERAIIAVVHPEIERALLRSVVTGEPAVIPIPITKMYLEDIASVEPEAWNRHERRKRRATGGKQ